MSVELIPILPDTEGLQALIESPRQYSLQRLAQMSIEDLRALQRAWYDEAYRRNVITTLHVIVRTLGQLDQPGVAFVWQIKLGNLLIDARLTFNSPSTLCIKINGLVVCTNETVGNELFKPGPWLQSVIQCFEQSQLEKRRAAERRELEEKQGLITILGAEV